MFTVCDGLHETKHKQTLESAQYGLEIIFKEFSHWILSYFGHAKKDL